MFDQDYLKARLHLDESNGCLTWKERKFSDFKDARAAKTWNSRFSGKKAFNHKDKNGYLCGRLNGKLFYAHQIIWMILYNERPIQIDHLNHKRDDNRVNNLEAKNAAGNRKNQSLSKKNTSGRVGVSYNIGAGKYLSYITNGYEREHLGVFSEFEDAVAAREKAEIKYGFHPNHGKQG